MSRRRRAVGLIRTRTNRPSNEPNGERALQTAGRIKATSKYIGEHQRSLYRQLCLQHAAHSPVQHRRSELAGKRTRIWNPTLADPTTVRQHTQDKSSWVPTKTKAHDRKKDSDLEPGSSRHNLANQATSLVDTVPTEETGQQHAYPSSERRKHKGNSFSGRYAARQAADLCK